MGKSIMFIVKKISDAPEFVGCRFEILRVSNHKSVIKYFNEKGLYTTPSKVNNRFFFSSFECLFLNYIVL
jgi:hypothetical protein